ncbi:glycosyltransferase family 2 protein [Candidatus Woesebacteria bacterium]|nr:glycosyltransferase family 2 protein [Candidatus Woesebacteria bacterium]
MKVKALNVSIVVPNYNGRDLLEKNLPSIIEASENKANKIIEIVLVDDGSTDDSVKYIKEAFSKVKVVKHTKNRGFSETVNTGVRTAQSKLVCLLNTDVKVTRKFLKSVFVHFNDDSVFGVSLHEKGYGWAKGKFEDGFVAHEPGNESKSVKESFWVSGGSGVFRRDLWYQVKGLDGDLFTPFYWEDIDLCYRAQKRGYKTLWDPNAKVLHDHESTIAKHSKTKKRQRIQERNQLLFIWKNITSPILFRKHMKGLFTRSLRHPGYLLIVYKALRKLPEVIKKRKVEKKDSTISDEAIFQKFI